MVIDFKRIERKWQSKWEKAKIFEAEPDKRKSQRWKSKREDPGYLRR